MTTTELVSTPVSYLAVVNKKRKLAQNYVPPQLKRLQIPFYSSSPPAKQLLRRKAATALEIMQQAAKKRGLQLTGVSGYRSYYRQKQIYWTQIKSKGYKTAAKVSAVPGYSEHQTGLAIDLSTPQINYRLTEEFGTTDLGKWLKKNSFKFGYILRYPPGKEQTTGYQYEPWHFRYVTVRHARKIFANNLTLDEY